MDIIFLLFGNRVWFASFLFYSYVAATIVYLIFGIFASTGNAALLIEHYRINSTNQEVENGDEKDVKNK